MTQEYGTFSARPFIVAYDQERGCGLVAEGVTAEEIGAALVGIFEAIAQIDGLDPMKLQAAMLQGMSSMATGGSSPSAEPGVQVHTLGTSG